MKRKSGVSLRKSAAEKKRSVKRPNSNAKKKGMSAEESARRSAKRESDSVTWSESNGTRNAKNERRKKGSAIVTEIVTEIEIVRGTETETGAATVIVIVTVIAMALARRRWFCLKR